MRTDHVGSLELDGETASLVQALSTEAPDDRGVATFVTIERLRRLEEAARFSGTTRQTLQKIASARRLLGDQTSLGPFKGPFLPD
jgi:hypothetical protein